MSQNPARESVVSIAQYLRETLAKMDQNILEMQERRHEFAVRLAVIEAAEDPTVLAAIAEHEERAGAPYEGAEDADSLLAEAHRHFVNP